MDLRQKKTKRSIKNAFLELRMRKPLERITIKELTEQAEVSKATFYLHYKDIYDLSHCMEDEVIQDLLNSISVPESILKNPKKFMLEFVNLFYSQKNIIDILFSGTQASILPQSLEREIKNYIFELEPSLRENAKFNIWLTYQIQGSYYAYRENGNKFGIDQVIDVVDEIARTFNLNFSQDKTKFNL